MIRGPAFAVLCLAAGVAHAQMHMCKDAQGRKVFSDQPCGNDDKIVDVNPASGGTSINPSSSIRVEHYDIRGTTWAELAREVDSKGPEGFWGSASSPIRYHFEATPSRGGCRAASVRVTTDARVRLPSWANRYEGSAALQAQWDSSYRSLDLHERGHVRISLDGAKELERVLNSIPEQPTCEALAAEGRRRAEEVLAAVTRRQVAYDAETNHGRNQWSPY
jgi:predicted secreted Zn-dependent protease